ncbi:MAG: hypothetical protein JXR96_28205 [Deltaproteobacteria bacterium]|nr:hypothetical protein [Deltaproteobacteria bacterium]
MAVIELTEENLESSIAESAVLLIDFWRPGCGPCMVFGPLFEKASESHPDLTFAKCNTHEQPGIAMAFGIQAVPTLAVFKDRALIFQQPGALPPAALEELIEKVRQLDMDALREEAGEARTEPGQKEGPDGAPPPPAQESKTVTLAVEAGEGMAHLAGDHLLRRQGVTREFIESARQGAGAAHEVLSFYDRLRQLIRDVGGSQAREEAARLHAGWAFDPDRDLADLDAETRSEARAVLRAIKDLLAD